MAFRQFLRVLYPGTYVNPRLRSMNQLSRDAKLLMAALTVFAASFYGVYGLLRVLYILRLGHGPEYVGLFSGAGALTFMAMGLPSGVLGNRLGVRKVMLAGGIITVAGIVLLPLVEFIPVGAQNLWPIATQILLTVGWSMFNVNFVPALMAATTLRNRSSAYALSSALRGFGTFAGLICGGMLPGLFAIVLGQTLDAPGPYRFGVWVGAALSLVALLPLSQIAQVKRVVSKERAEASGPFPVLMIALLIAHVFLTRVGWASCRAFCSAYLDTDLRLSPSSIGLITGAGQFVAMLAPLLAPRLAARRSNGWMLMVTSLGTAVSLVPLALIPHWAPAGLGSLGIVAMSAIWIPTLQIFQMELVDDRWRSLAYGALTMGMGLSFGSVSIAGGYVIAAVGYRSVFLIGGVLSAAGAVLMWGIRRSSIIRSTL